ncbi:hypothetical protein BC827DRAFT_1227793 [Russula dissimulans]|nr:hypothetical protein BC827DRAFT_1227793 [Russula dissimulans]
MSGRCTALTIRWTHAARASTPMAQIKNNPSPCARLIGDYWAEGDIAVASEATAQVLPYAITHYLPSFSAHMTAGVFELRRVEGSLHFFLLLYDAKLLSTGLGEEGRTPRRLFGPRSASAGFRGTGKGEGSKLDEPLYRSSRTWGRNSHPVLVFNGHFTMPLLPSVLGTGPRHTFSFTHYAAILSQHPISNLISRTNLVPSQKLRLYSSCGYASKLTPCRRPFLERRIKIAQGMRRALEKLTIGHI